MQKVLSAYDNRTGVKMATQGLEQFITYNASHAEGTVALSVRLSTSM